MVPFRKSKVVPPPQVCPFHECMKLITGTWTVNVIWYLREGHRRFSELKHDLDGISAKTLTARLRQLEKDGLVHRELKQTSPPTVEYELTAMGQRLLPAIEAIMAVGHDLKLAKNSAQAQISTS